MSELDDKSTLIQITQQNVADFFEDRLKPFAQFLIYLRVPLTIAVTSYVFFSRVDQTVEVYRAIALDVNVIQAFFSTGFVFLLSLSIWYAARLLEIWYKGQSSESDESRLNGLYVWAPRLLGITPLLSLSLGIWSARGTWQGFSNPIPLIFLLIWLIVNLILSAILLAVLFVRTMLFSRVEYLKRFTSVEKDSGLFGQEFENIFVNLACFIFSLFSLPLILAAKDSPRPLGLIAIFLLITCLNVPLFFWQTSPEKRRKIIWACLVSLLAPLVPAFLMPPTFLPDLLGSISVLAVSFTILVVVFSTIFNWGQQTKVPGITILIGLVVIASMLNLNDNHRFRQLINSERSTLPSLESSFEQWLANRPDRDRFPDKPYPVYIAAAQGGGIYAAYHAATALTRLTEYFPSFPQHVFAISGVSGGSLGASVFSSLVKTDDIKPDALSQTARQLFSGDLLAPLLTMGLFPDLIQRFIFFPIYDWDRAIGLEVAFENAWDQLSLPTQENPLRQSFYQHWSPEGIAPALVLNTTVVETGDRLVISPFQIQLPNLENMVMDEPGLDFKLSTAAVLSARFPYFTPVGWYQRSRDKSKLRLADGGYFDNSGIPTALDMGRSLQRLKGYGTSFEIIYLSLIDGKSKGSTTQLKSPGLNEVLSPVRALFSARESRSRSAVELSSFTVNDGIDDPLKYKFRTLFLKKSGNGVSLPLGWLISDRSRAFIDQQTPDPREKPCGVQKFRQGFASGRAGLLDDNHNRCVVASIGHDLSE